jgi:hypothetical protein
MNKLNVLVENFLLGVVVAEEIRFCKNIDHGLFWRCKTRLSHQSSALRSDSRSPFRSDIVIDGLAGLTVYPPNVQ